MTWINRAFGVAVVLVGGCSAENQLVGSDGLAVGGAPNSRPPAESTGKTEYFIDQLVQGPGKCLPRPLPLAPTGNANCKVLTARTGAACSCTAPGLAPTTDSVVAAVRRELEIGGGCGGPYPGSPPCANYCACEVAAATGTSLTQCQTAQQPDASSSGWCYVAASAGAAQAALVSECPANQSQILRFIGDATIDGPDFSFIGCSSGTPPLPPAALGEPCVSSDEYRPDFPGYGWGEINVDDGAPMCSTNLCVQNHFRGRASCPYGQQLGGTGCLIPGTIAVPVAVSVPPQLVERRANVASICSCQCAGTGPGPYCSCPESMQCEHLIDDLGLTPAGAKNLSGSYCIPKGSQFEVHVSEISCLPPNCGAAHPY